MAAKMVEGKRHKVFMIEIAEPYSLVENDDLKAFIHDAVSSWAGSLEPPNEDNHWEGNPLWGLSAEHIKVWKSRKNKRVRNFGFGMGWRSTRRK